MLTTTGFTLPVTEITAMAKKHGVAVVLDGAQALGIAINATAIGCDAYITRCSLNFGICMLPGTPASLIT